MERAFWRGIIEDRYTLPEGYALVELTIELLEYLQSTDAELRDAFGYNILARWIIIFGHYSREELRVMIEWLTPKLNEGIGEQNTDTVFLRSYSALVLSLVIYRDNQTSFLTQEEARTILDCARQYLLSERDVRAYVPGKGWANACSHTADLLKFLARCRHLEGADLTRIMDTIANKLTLDLHIYAHDEDDRLAQVVLSVLRRDLLSLEELSAWLRRFREWKLAHAPSPNDFNPAHHATFQNIRNFLRALYAQMQLATYLSADLEAFQADVLTAVRSFSL
jgi:hypothetical protein